MGFENRDYQRSGFGMGGGSGGPPGGFRQFGGLAIPVPQWGSVTVWLLLLNAGVFLLDGLMLRVTNTAALSAFGYFSFDTALGQFQIWRFVTFQFLHGGFGHLLGNCLGLFFFGPMVESYLGSRRFLAYYLVSGTVGALAYLLLLMLGVIVVSPATPLIGASGGVFAILAGAATVAPNARVLLFFIIPVPLKVLIWGLLFIAAFAVLAQGDDPTSNAGGQAAHLGGALMGFLFIRNPNWLNWSDPAARRSRRGGVGKLVQRARDTQQQRAQQQRRREDEEVDRILAKVREHGLHSLSSDEQRTLQRATERQRGGR